MKVNKILLASTVILATVTGCAKKTEQTKLSIKQTTTTIAYAKDGDPVDPLELVAIDRADDAEKSTESETKDTVATSEATVSASADSDSKEEISEDSEKESSKENESTTDSDEEETDETVDLADEAYIADGLEIEKVYPEVIDTSVVGDVKVLFTVKDTENNDNTAELSVTFTVVNETAPAFKLTKTEDTVTVNSEFDAKSYIKDDAGCEYVEEEPEDSSEYENGWYTINSDVSTEKAGSYKVKYHAENASGVSNDVTLKITVKKNETSSTNNKDESSVSEKKAKNSNVSNSADSEKKSSNIHSSNNSTSSMKGSTSSTSSNNSQPSTSDTSATQQVHVHDWQPVYETIQHEATGHYENEGYWDECIVCNHCNQSFTGANQSAEYNAHVTELLAYGDQTDDYSAYYAASYHTAPYYVQTGTKWVEDTPASTEQKLSYYKCSTCGATK